MLAQDTDISTFCCTDSAANYNVSANYCSFPTLNSDTPFNLANGRVIMGRTTGSTVLADRLVNGTAQTTVTTTVTATSHIKPQASTHKPDNAALGAGLGVGLGVPLLLLATAVLILWRQRRKELVAYQHAATIPDNREVKEQQPMQHRELNGYARPHELRGNAVGELYGVREAELGNSTSSN